MCHSRHGHTVRRFSGSDTVTGTASTGSTSAVATVHLHNLCSSASPTALTSQRCVRLHGIGTDGKQAQQAAARRCKSAFGSRMCTAM
jgi:hypothetical protein